MSVELADGFADRLLLYCDQAHVVLRGAQPSALAMDAMNAARDRLYEVPHPDEDDCFIHLATEVTAGPDGPTFWVDAADAGQDGVLDALISAMLAGLAEAGLTDGTLDCQPGGHVTPGRPHLRLL
jgi:hypothetical protein